MGPGALPSGKRVHTFRGHTGPVYSLAFAPDGRCLLSGSEDTSLRLWDLEVGQSLLVLEGHTGVVRAVALSHDGKWVATGRASW